MSSSTAVRASRVAGTIGAVKWVLVALMLLAAGISVLVALMSGEASALGIGLGVAFASVIYAVGIWVLFGWFELTLRALADITTNTAGLLPQQQFQQYQGPPAY